MPSGCVFFICFKNADCQTRVSGIVTDSLTSKPMAYVTVIFKGTAIGAVSNDAGKYTT